jgi:hypothetical protein
MHISMLARLISSVSCFVTHLAQILWYLRSSWMMEYAEFEIVGYISDSKQYVLLNQSINFFNTVHRPRSGRTAVPVLSTTLVCHFRTFLPVGTPSFEQCSFLRIALTLFCVSRRVLGSLTTKIEWQHVDLQRCNPKAETIGFHYNCMSFA